MIGFFVIVECKFESLRLLEISELLRKLRKEISEKIFET